MIILRQKLYGRGLPKSKAGTNFKKILKNARKANQLQKEAESAEAARALIERNKKLLALPNSRQAMGHGTLGKGVANGGNGLVTTGPRYQQRNITFDNSPRLMNGTSYDALMERINNRGRESLGSSYLPIERKMARTNPTSQWRYDHGNVPRVESGLGRAIDANTSADITRRRTYGN